MNRNRKPIRPSRAIVIGGGAAGLFAARALAPHFERILVLERSGPEASSWLGTSCGLGRAAHLLWHGGYEAVDRLVPGLLEELQAAGTSVLDFARDVAWVRHGRTRPRFGSQVRSLIVTRPSFEERLRRRVERLPSVSFSWNSPVVDLATDDSGRAIDGVWVERPAGQLTRLAAELVVDASGAGSTVASWLARRHLPAPQEESVAHSLRCATGLYRRRRREPADWRALVAPPEPPRTGRGGVVLEIDSAYWLVSLLGHGSERPPAQPSEIPDFAATLPEALRAVLREATLVSPLSFGVLPRLTRRRWELVRELPEGLIAIGEAFCQTQPMLGHGLSSAAMQADGLARLCGRRRGGSMAVLARAYFRMAAAVSELPWRLSQAPNGPAEAFYALPARSPAWYRAAIDSAAGSDHRVYEALLDVWHGRRAEASLARPAIAARTLRDALAAARRRRAASRGDQSGRGVEPSSGLRPAVSISGDASGSFRLD